MFVFERSNVTKVNLYETAGHGPRGQAIWQYPSGDAPEIAGELLLATRTAVPHVQFIQVYEDAVPSSRFAETSPKGWQFDVPQQNLHFERAPPGQTTRRIIGATRQPRRKKAARTKLGSGSVGRIERDPIGK